MGVNLLLLPAASESSGAMQSLKIGKKPPVKGTALREASLQFCFRTEKGNPCWKKEIPPPFLRRCRAVRHLCFGIIDAPRIHPA